MTEGLGDARESVRNAISFLYRIMDEEGPFEGIIGYPEGNYRRNTLAHRVAKVRRERETTNVQKCSLLRRVTSNDT
jgi:hypothetical protein